jgi:hypothetical protein
MQDCFGMAPIILEINPGLWLLMERKMVYLLAIMAAFKEATDGGANNN